MDRETSLVYKWETLTRQDALSEWETLTRQETLSVRRPSQFMGGGPQRTPRPRPPLARTLLLDKPGSAHS